MSRASEPEMGFMADHGMCGMPEPEHGASMSRAARALRYAASLPIVVYQRVISPGLPRRCRYEPTCSRYAVLAIREYGILRGSVLAAWRLIRCNPWSPGGYDPVGAQRIFKVSAPSGVRR